MNALDAEPSSPAGSDEETPAVLRQPAIDAMDIGPPINILIVDDEPANLVVLESVLSDRAYRLVRAQSADEALMALMQEEFALLVLDVHMPGMSGFELAAMVKERKKTAGVPIIFLTAYFDQDQHMLAGYGSGAVDYLNKPVNPAVLRSKVAVFADLHRTSRELALANSVLTSEVRERRRADEALRSLNESLERRVAERTQELTRADQKLQSIMASITDGLLTLDSDWRFTYCNEQGARLLGMRSEDLVGKNIWALFPALRESKFFEGVHRAVQTRHTVSFEEGHPVDPERRWLECHCYPSDDGVSVYFHEITERRQAEALREQLLAAEQAARTEGERVARAKDNFLTTLSHELRTPLAAILGWAAVLKRPNTTEDILRRGLNAITENAKVQTKLVSELLDTSRIVSGKLRIELELLDLNTVATAAAETVRPLAQAKGVLIELALTEHPATMMGDSGRLAQIALNLLSNAVKFTPPNGVVTLATRVDRSHLDLIVSDTGAGIDPDFLPHLFDRFTQADGSAARAHGGLGLGLSIVKDLVELHAGKVHVESRGAGLGSTFQVSFRAAQGQDGKDAEASDDTARQHAEINGIRVLIVDDHDDVLEVQERLLGECGALVRTAHSGDEALRMLEEEAFDVLLSDLGMPGMDGYQLIEAVRACADPRVARMPAAAITAFVRAEDRKRALEAGFQVFLQKPISPTALAHAVESLARGVDSTSSRAAAG
ncbi:MAG: response regulator [Pseudomonadota bacterium]|nr:response regulator [Pseudomonadota bacterium]